MVTRILTSMFAAELFDNPQTGSLKDNVTSEAHTLLARKLGASANALLKNDNNLLPLNVSFIINLSWDKFVFINIKTSNLKTIAVIGDDANDNPIYHGTGSGNVKSPYVVTPLQGIQSRAGANVHVSYLFHQIGIMVIFFIIFYLCKFGIDFGCSATCKEF